MVKIGLVGCTKSKLSAPSAARDLYSPSALFRGRLAYVDRNCDRWFVLSAKHRVVGPDEVLEPYDVTLVGASRQVKRRWTATVFEELSRKLGELSSHHFEIHAGHDYWGFGLVEGLEKSGATVGIPTRGLGQGEQLAFYARWARGSASSS